MDLAFTIDYLVPQAEYYGSTNANNEEQYNALVWNDERDKPLWSTIVSTWTTVQHSAKKGNLADILSGMISQGQSALSGENALPFDIQEQVYELELKLMHFSKRNPKLLKPHIEDFIIPVERQDVTTQQRQTVEYLKGVMIAEIDLILGE